MRHYIIRPDGTFYEEPDLMKYARWFESCSMDLIPDGGRCVGRDTLTVDGEEMDLSTVFLGLDHGNMVLDGHPPVVFETMIFGGKYDEFQKRYYTYEEAKREHTNIWWRLTHGLPPENDDD